MEKLELKHLAPYLPYGFVNVLVNDGNLKYIDCITSISLIDECISFDKSQDWYYGEGEDEINIKPIFRSLSDLTKEIEINGKIFVPIEYFVDSSHDDIQSFILDTLYTDKEPYCLEYGAATKLIEWHFDVFGLIDKGLAIDIKTLK